MDGTWILAFMLTVLRSTSATLESLNMTEYYMLPKLYKYDDFDRCLHEFDSKAVYCLIDTTIKPNTTATIWPLIQKYSNDTKRSFRHDRIQRGFCMNWCKKIMEKYDRMTQRKYFLSKFNESSEITFDSNTFRTGLDWRIKYKKLANMCVNFELKRQYSIMGHSVVEYCVTNRDREPVDYLDMIFLVVLGSIILAVGLSTFYDYTLKRKYSPEIRSSEYYRVPVRRGLSQKLVAFSVSRNWQTLVAKRKTTLSKDLRFIQSARFLVMYLVIAGHCMLFNCIFPLLNPEYVEVNYRRLVTMIIFNGTTVIQTYFTISGFLLAVQFTNYFEKNKAFTARDFFASILYRYLRLAPLYIFMILLDATWLFKIQDGPVWKRIAETERTFCRKNFWANILFINNYFTVDEPCLQQSWYLATDFQLFVAGQILLASTRRFPKLLKPTLAVAVVSSLVSCAFVTYVNRFEGVIMLRPEAIKYVLWYDESYRKMYIPTHTNYGSYLAGLIAGLAYMKLKRSECDVRRHKLFLIAWYSGLPLAIMLLLSAYIFYAYDFEKPAIWIAIYAAFSKNLWGVILAVLFVGLAFGVGGTLKRLLSNPIFRPLGKVTYAVYLCHSFVIRTTLGNIRQPIYVSDVRILVSTSSTLVLSYILGLLLCLGIEIPLSNLQKQLFDKKPETLYEENVELKNGVHIEATNDLPR
ncbi:nose resistant to fluoxetine protein 6-like [Toxorhynchites rutilus septentrionalis]|uniref:nose resistant to fluoxetine protein 6-like n=1 Tax=Toxorhynchites rutilus septentrionalis TaxID=329112 RepID=UPI0024795B49|nr:nose resistant to fluoxetine protein 6-like [Toxorhynchites rutilus septentrionalis]XP_055629972.1 nose resistant to fluoxetine protein 6-like [Toxorhynchites rutilus septentrionalis]